MKKFSAILLSLACVASFWARAETHSPLVQAVFDNDLIAAQQMLDSGVDPSALDASGDRPLQNAVTLGRIGLIQLLLARGANPNLGSSSGLTPMIMAVSAGNLEIIRLLIDHGAKIDLTSKNRWPPLLYAKKPEVTRLLIEKGANVGIANDSGHTALHQAAMAGYTEIAELLLDNGVNPSVANHLGQTPLATAVWSGKEAVVKLLIARGVDISLRDMAGKTALDIAKEKGLVKIAQVIEQSVAEKKEQDRRLAQKELEERVAAQPCRLQEEQWLLVSGRCAGNLAEGSGQAENIDRTRSFQGLFKQGRFVSGKFLKDGKLFYDGSWSTNTGGIGRGTCYGDVAEPCEYKEGRRVDAIYVERVARREAEARERQAREDLERLQRRLEQEDQKLANLDNAIQECQRQALRERDENTEATCDNEGNLDTYRHNRGNQARNAQLFNQFNRSMDELARTAARPSKPKGEFSVPGSHLAMPIINQRPTDNSSLERQIQDARRKLEMVQQENRTLQTVKGNPQETLTGQPSRSIPLVPVNSAQSRPAVPAQEWGASVPEAIVACWTNNQRTQWFCDGPLQETLVGDENINKARDLAGCNPKEDQVREIGVSGQYRVFGCGRGLRPNERDMRSRRNVDGGSNRYRCLKADMDRGKKCSQLAEH